MIFNTSDNDNTRTGTGHFIVLDCEFLRDWPLYERYRRIDRKPAPCRYPMKRVVSASVMVLTVCDRRLEASAFKSFTGGDEDSVVVQLFEYLNERPRHQLVTYGGVATDLPILRIAAMEADLSLPPQLRFVERSRPSHLDLAITMRAGGNYVHLSELATRLGIPCKLAGPAAQVPKLFAAKDFRAIAHISEADIISTALLLASYLKAQGEVFSAKAAQLNIIQHVRPLRARADYSRILGNTADRLRGEYADEINTWMRRVA